jgi:hypothetical protein
MHVDFTIGFFEHAFVDCCAFAAAIGIDKHAGGGLLAHR